MSLPINPNRVTMILLHDGEWHRVERGSLIFGACEFVEGDDEPAVSLGPGFRFTVFDDDEGIPWTCEVTGPISSIQAVQTSH
jgi:hypothetical protein